MKLRMICIFVCLSILLSSHVFAAQEPEAIAQNTDERETVETIALDYIAQYVSNAYLYEENDLKKGTIREAVDESLIAQTDTARLTAAGETTSAATLADRMESFQLAAGYYRYIRTAQNITRYDFSYTPTVVESSVDGNSAVVRIYTYITFKYERNGDEAACGDNYAVYLMKLQNRWTIADVQAEELTAYGLTDLKDTYAERIAAFDEMLASRDTLTTDTAEPIVSPLVTPTSYDRAYNANNAIAYAYTYTTSSYNSVPDSGNNYGFLNGNFTNYTDSGGNCQNFVSQCLWAGFGGNNYLCDKGINTEEFPMYAQWYGDKNSNCTLAWITVNDFYRHVISDSSQIISTHALADGSFGQIPLSSLRGAVLNVNEKADKTGFKHAVLITKATGRSCADIEICGNSPMRKAVRLIDQYGANKMRVIMPSAMKRRSACPNGAHDFSGSHCKCSYCDFNKLTVTGTILKPVPVGSTQTITASASTNCYRMAVNVQYDEKDAARSWTEYLNTNQVSRSFTFTRTGLYVITIVARDVSPSDANSITSTHVFKIRVY